MQGIEDGSGIGHQVIAGKFIRAAIVADLAVRRPKAAPWPVTAASHGTVMVG